MYNELYIILHNAHFLMVHFTMHTTRRFNYKGSNIPNERQKLLQRQLMLHLNAMDQLLQT